MFNIKKEKIINFDNKTFDELKNALDKRIKIFNIDLSKRIEPFEIKSECGYFVLNKDEGKATYKICFYDYDKVYAIDKISTVLLIEDIFPYSKELLIFVFNEFLKNTTLINQIKTKTYTLKHKNSINKFLNNLKDNVQIEQLQYYIKEREELQEKIISLNKDILSLKTEVKELNIKINLKLLEKLRLKKCVY